MPLQTRPFLPRLLSAKGPGGDRRVDSWAFGDGRNVTIGGWTLTELAEIATDLVEFQSYQ